MEKSLRVLSGDERAEGHSHGHSHSHVNTSASAVASGVSITPSSDGLRPRNGEKGGGSGQSEQVDLVQTGPGPSKLSAYLNLFGDFVHNMYDFFLALRYCPY
jgi:zinc transporter 7